MGRRAHSAERAVRHHARAPDDRCYVKDDLHDAEDGEYNDNGDEIMRQHEDVAHDHPCGVQRERHALRADHALRGAERGRTFAGQ